MRKLIRMFDLDDARWMVVLIVGVMCCYALDAGWRAEDAVARAQAKAWDHEAALTGMEARIEKLEAERQVAMPVQVPIDLPRGTLVYSPCSAFDVRSMRVTE